MTDDEWAKTKHFKKTDNWGDPDRISPRLVAALDELRDRINQPIFISIGTQGAHIKNSQHYLGLAADLVFPDAKSLQEVYSIYREACQIDDLKGLGLYPSWHYKGKVVGGIHADVRETERRAMWMGVVDESGSQVYIAITNEHLKKYGFV